MANNQYINKVVYGGGTVLDLTSDTVSAGKLFINEIAHDKSGATIIGTHNPYPTLSITPPTKTSYTAGDTLDLTGMAVTGVMDSGYTKDITNDCTFTPDDGDTLTSSDQSIDVSYTFLGKTIHGTQNLDVSYIDHIYVATPPTKVSYEEGEQLDLTGIVVKAVWGDGTEEVITNACTFNPSDGTALSTETRVGISWTWNTTGQVFNTIQLISVSVKIVSWATGTDAEITAMINAHYANKINIYDYWHVGDSRSVNISAMSSYSALNDAYNSQNINLVIMNKGGKTLTTSINGHTECAFIVGTKSFLNGSGDTWINVPQYTGGWDVCMRREWCNKIFRNALPETFRPLFKQFNNVTNYDTSTNTKTSVDYFSLPAITEIGGSDIRLQTYLNVASETSLSQFEYFANLYAVAGKVELGKDWWSRSHAKSGTSYGIYVKSHGESTSDASGTSNNKLIVFGVI